MEIFQIFSIFAEFVSKVITLKKIAINHITFQIFNKLRLSKKLKRLYNNTFIKENNKR